MMDEIRYEIVRLRTLRSTYWLIGIGLVLNAALAGVVAHAARKDLNTDALGALMTSGSAFSPLPFLAVVVGLIGAFVFGHEYRHGTITATLAALPRRSRLVTAKVAVLAVSAAAIAVVGLALNWVVASIVTTRMLPVFDHGLTNALLGFVGYVVLWGLFGLAMGLLVRNLPVVVTMLFIIPLVIEPLLSALLLLPFLKSVKGISAYFPFTAGSQLPAVGTDSGRGFGGVDMLSRGAGGLVFLAWIVLVLVPGWVLFKRRDA